MNKAVGFSIDLNPFESEPSHVSRIAGLGGRRPAADPDYAFRTAPLVVTPGHFDVTITFDCLHATRGTLLIEVVEGPGIERRQVRLRTVALAEMAARGGIEHLSIENDRGGAYSVAGYIHDDTDAAAGGMTIHILSNQSAMAAQGTLLSNAMMPVGRLAGLALPSFAHPSSQTWSPAQEDEPAYRTACRALGIDDRTASWPEAYVYKALCCLLGDLSGLKGFGVTVHSGALLNALKSQDVETFVSERTDPAHWPSFTELDFAWLVNEGQTEDARIVVWTALALIDRLRPGGALVMVLPFEHGRMSQESSEVLTRNDVEVLGLRLLAQGHGVAQLKFRPANQAFPSGTRTPFGMMLRKVS